MSWIKIEEARLSFNARLTEKNKAEGKPENEGHLSQNDITRLIHEGTDAYQQKISVYTKRLFHGGTGEKKTINIETVKELCRILDTTPNFLFGHETKEP